MSGRFVRKSSFRHVFGAPAKPDKQFLQIAPQVDGDGNFIAGNSKFFCFAGRGGGGPVQVISMDKPGRVDTNLPRVEVHRAKVLDFDWNPFNDHILATGSEDCYVKVVQIPEGGMTHEIKEPLATLEGHEKKVHQLKWHPIANNILATASYDPHVKIWDVSTSSCAITFSDHEDAVQSIAWNRNGSLLATASKDKKIRVFDPRDTKSVVTVPGFEGGKKSSVLFMENKVDLLACVGFSRGSMRQVMFFDRKNMAHPIHSMDIDQSAGVFIPYYDHDTSIFYLAGKGDASVKYYEIVPEAPYCHFLSEFRDNQSQKGLCFLPKIACDTHSCEIASALRLMRDSVVPVSFQVPRKSDLFQKDLFPDTIAPIPALEAAAWLAGENAEPKMTSMKPGEKVSGGHSTFSAKKSYAELEHELQVALARIKELEAR